MAPSHLILSRLRYIESEHGWALAVGSFLAAWNTAFRGLVSAESDQKRVLILERMRMYAYNIQRRLVARGAAVDAALYKPRNFRELETTMMEIASNVRKTNGMMCSAFLLLGSAATFAELGTKAGMAKEYYGPSGTSADSAIMQLLALCPRELPAGEVKVELIRGELERLKTFDGLRKSLTAGGRGRGSPPIFTEVASTDRMRPLNDAREMKKGAAAVVVERELPQLLAGATI